MCEIEKRLIGDDREGIERKGWMRRQQCVYRQAFVFVSTFYPLAVVCYGSSGSRSCAGFAGRVKEESEEDTLVILRGRNPRPNPNNSRKCLAFAFGGETDLALSRSLSISLALSLIIIIIITVFSSRLDGRWILDVSYNTK